MIERSHDRDPLEELAAAFLEEHRLGEAPRIEDYADRYPDLADEIRDLFPTIAELENLKLKKEQATPTQAVAGLASVQCLGDYRLIKEIGRGGMGVVYEAEQMSLQRRVALKVLGANIANSAKQLTRFKREAEASAKLHHTHIVPVLGIGEEKGVHFFVMQLVEGEPFNKVLRFMANERRDRQSKEDTKVEQRDLTEQAQQTKFAGPVDSPNKQQETRAERDKVSQTPPVPPPISMGADTGRSDQRDPSGTLHASISTFAQPRAIASIVADLADALHYAHEHGVLHRDIKPANILVDRHGDSWITDFGLASHEDWDELTQTGDILGTLRYMAPEQFAGNADRRSDIYSLGLTLYEMLTLTPAFPNSQQAVMVQQKLSRSVRSPREQNPEVSKDLETITLKACAQNPEHRYQTASEFALDLRRFLSDRPIQARRVSIPERFVRWSKRNPVVAGLSGIAALLLITVAVVGATGLYTTELALEQARKEQGKSAAAAKEATEANQRAEDNLNLALQSLDEIADQIALRSVPQSLVIDSDSGDAMWESSVVNKGDAALLETLLKFSREFSLQNQRDTTAETVETHRRIGDIQTQLGQYELAIDAYRQALEEYNALVERGGDLEQLAIDGAKTWNGLAVAYSHEGSLSNAVKAHLNAVELLESLDDLVETEAGKFQLAQSFGLLGSVWARSDGTRVIVDAMEGRPDRRRGPFGGPERGRWFPSRADMEQMFGPRGGRRFGERGDGPSVGRGRGPGPRPLVSGSPEAPEHRPPGPPPHESFSNPDVRRLWSKWIGPKEDPLLRSIGLLEELVQEHPDNTIYQLTLARTYRNRVQSRRHQRGPGSEVTQQADKSVALLQSLASQRPQAELYKSELAKSLQAKARLLGSLNRDEHREEVLDLGLEAAAIVQTLLEQNPANESYQSLLGELSAQLASESVRANRMTEARPLFDTALRYQKALAEKYQDKPIYPLAYAKTLAEFAEFQQTQGRLIEAHGALSEAIDAAEAIAEQPGRNQEAAKRFVDGLARHQLLIETRLIDEAARPNGRRPRPGERKQRDR